MLGNLNRLVCMKKNVLHLIILLIINMSFSIVFANDDSCSMLKITDAWARKSIPPNNNSAAYMKISNNSEQDIVIIGASAAMVANNLELHNSFIDENGISRMTSLGKIVVPAKSKIELSPGALHIMIFDLKKSLNIGDKFDISIKIENDDKPIIIETNVK